MSGTEGSGVLALRLADLLENARKVPLLRDRVRVDKQQVYQLATGIDEALRLEAADRPIDKAAGLDLLQVKNAVRDAVSNAYPVPLTDQVRLPREQATELALALRASARL